MLAYRPIQWIFCLTVFELVVSGLQEVENENVKAQPSEWCSSVTYCMSDEKCCTTNTCCPLKTECCYRGQRCCFGNPMRSVTAMRAKRQVGRSVFNK